MPLYIPTLPALFVPNIPLQAATDMLSLYISLHFLGF